MCGSRFISLEEINTELKEVEKRMNDFEADLDVNTKKDLYLGIAFITFRTQ